MKNLNGEEMKPEEVQLYSFDSNMIGSLKKDFESFINSISGEIELLKYSEEWVIPNQYASDITYLRFEMGVFNVYTEPEIPELYCEPICENHKHPFAIKNRVCFPFPTERKVCYLSPPPWVTLDEEYKEDEDIKIMGSYCYLDERDQIINDYLKEKVK